MKATIIGAGIGGLTTAIALQQRGIEVEIFESTAEFKKVGAGIVLAFNAMQVFKRLGIAEKLLTAGVPLQEMRMSNAKANRLAGSDLKALGARYKVMAVGIHRAALHQVLLDALPKVPIHLNKKLKQLNQKAQIHLEFEDGTQHTTDLLIGADGVKSAVRQSIFPNSELRWSGQLCWRGIAPFKLPNEWQARTNESMGAGKRFGWVPVDDKTVYWYACINNNAGEKYTISDLKPLFQHFNPLVGQLLAATPVDKIITNELGDLLPLPKWHTKNIVLVGDAAHATTPNIGQGANQAIESAWTLAKCIAEEQDLEQAFVKYRALRHEKAHQVIKMSWQVGKIAHLSNPVLCHLRNFMFRMVPNFVNERQMRKLYDLNC